MGTIKFKSGSKNNPFLHFKKISQAQWGPLMSEAKVGRWVRHDMVLSMSRSADLVLSFFDTTYLCTNPWHQNDLLVFMVLLKSSGWSLLWFYGEFINTHPILNIYYRLQTNCWRFSAIFFVNERCMYDIWYTFWILKIWRLAILQ